MQTVTLVVFESSGMSEGAHLEKRFLRLVVFLYTSRNEQFIDIAILE